MTALLNSTTIACRDCTLRIDLPLDSDRAEVRGSPIAQYVGLPHRHYRVLGLAARRAVKASAVSLSQYLDRHRTEVVMRLTAKEFARQIHSASGKEWSSERQNPAAAEVRVRESFVAGDENAKCPGFRVLLPVRTALCGEEPGCGGIRTDDRGFPEGEWLYPGPVAGAKMETPAYTVSTPKRMLPPPAGALARVNERRILARRSQLNEKCPNPSLFRQVFPNQHVLNQSKMPPGKSSPNPDATVGRE